MDKKILPTVSLIRSYLLKMNFLVDGYNVIKQVDALRDKRLEEARLCLTQMLQEKYLRGSKLNQVTVVFDGKDNLNSDKAKMLGSMKIIFSCGLSADQLIKKMLEDASHPKQMKVVTDDKEIISFARSLGAGTMAVFDFMKIKRNPPQKSTGELKSTVKPELTYQQQEAINRELRKIWR